MIYILEASPVPLIASLAQVGGIILVLSAIPLHNRLLLLAGSIIAICGSLLLSDVTMATGIALAVFCLWQSVKKLTGIVQKGKKADKVKNDF